MWPGFVFGLEAKRGLSLLAVYFAPKGAPWDASIFPSHQEPTLDFSSIDLDDDLIFTLPLLKAPESKAGQKKKGKQTTLLKTQSRNEQQAADAITLSEDGKKSQKKSVKK